MIRRAHWGLALAALIALAACCTPPPPGGPQEPVRLPQAGIAGPPPPPGTVYVLPRERRAPLLATFARNAVAGMVEAGRLLRDAAPPGRDVLVLDGPFGPAAVTGIPRAWRPYFAGWTSTTLTRRTDRTIAVELRFARWLKARPIITGSKWLHSIGLYMSHAERVTGVLALDALRDPRLDGPPGWAEVKKARDTVFSEVARATAYPGGHPWRQGSGAVGVEQLDGYSLQITVSGLTQKRIEVLPVMHLYTIPATDEIWITYLDAEDLYEQGGPVVTPTTDPAFGPSRAFLPYRRRPPRGSDVIGFFNMTANSRNAPVGK